MEPTFYGQTPDGDTPDDMLFASMPTPVDENLHHAVSVEMEPGWMATRALLQVGGDELLTLMLRPSFQPVRDLDLVPVSPCEHCGDGGMRTAGTLRTRHGRQLLRSCDTCGAIRIGDDDVGPRRPPVAEA